MRSLVDWRLLQSRVSKQLVQHVRLFVVVRGKHNVGHDVLEHLLDQSTTLEEGAQEELTLISLPSSFLISSVSHTS